MGSRPDYAKLVNESFKALSAIYPMMEKIYQDKTSDEISDVKKQWFIGMRDARLNDSDIARGLAHARRDENKMPPSLGSFIEMCIFKPIRDDSIYHIRRFDRDNLLSNVLARKRDGMDCMEFNNVSDADIQAEIDSLRVKKIRTPEQQKAGEEHLEKMRQMFIGDGNGL